VGTQRSMGFRNEAAGTGRMGPGVGVGAKKKVYGR
jgi:hypothetical protein